MGLVWHPHHCGLRKVKLKRKTCQSLPKTAFSGQLRARKQETPGRQTRVQRDPGPQDRGHGTDSPVWGKETLVQCLETADARLSPKFLPPDSFSYEEWILPSSQGEELKYSPLEIRSKRFSLKRLGDLWNAGLWTALLRNHHQSEKNHMWALTSAVPAELPGGSQHQLPATWVKQTAHSGSGETPDGGNCSNITPRRAIQHVSPQILERQ